MKTRSGTKKTSKIPYNPNRNKKEDRSLNQDKQKQITNKEKEINRSEEKSQTVPHRN
ncbi:MAG TPA: hypothetical protein VFW11_07945 [Cyclobacteriaceae bacterium]|nr:hypothetical protein [Cyclobacteriaceae bacterium]